jgi:hypothetical protein
MPFLPPTPYHYVTKGLIAADITQYIMPTFQQNLYVILQDKKNQFYETQQVSEL